MFLSKAEVKQAQQNECKSPGQYMGCYIFLPRPAASHQTQIIGRVNPNWTEETSNNCPLQIMAQEFI